MNERNRFNHGTQGGQRRGGRHPNHGSAGGRDGNSQEKGSNREAASPSVIGERFHNPYTFIPFPSRENAAERFAVTPLSIDEAPDERDRISGMLVAEVTTVSPLLTCSPDPVDPESSHKKFRIMAMGDDVILPATGIRGSLRTLMTILTGGTLGYMDEELFLTQMRDAQLGPQSKRNTDPPKNVFLARVVEPGSAERAGRVQLGETRLVKADKLGDVQSLRPPTRETPLRETPLYIETPDSPGIPARNKPCDNPWELKLSGEPVNPKGKREGAFRSDEKTPIPLPSYLWTDYMGRNRHSFRPALKAGDLIWLEPNDKDCSGIESAADVKSIQWARWGRTGVSLRCLIDRHHPHVLPDSMKTDGGVDLVTDLFGQIPHKNATGAAGPFAARVRPGNLVFRDAISTKRVEPEITLAPLSAPHPGCIAFYRDGEDLDNIGKDSPLKGYKVYRNTSERGDRAPWHYSVQGVYDEKGNLKKPEQNVNKTVDLLKEGTVGTLRIAFRGLMPLEFSLLCAACSVDWKLGGGKPLGLGHCRVTQLRAIDEEGKELFSLRRDASDPEPMVLRQVELDEIASFQERIALYQETQRPVPRLRYPRAVEQNQNRTMKAGLSWFSRHASPRKSGNGGLETLWTKGDLQKQVEGKTQIRAQVLRRVVKGKPQQDALFGYDCVIRDSEQAKNKRTLVGRIESFDEQRHHRDSDRSGPNTSPNRMTRQKKKEDR